MKLQAAIVHRPDAPCESWKESVVIELSEEQLRMLARAIVGVQMLEQTLSNFDEGT